MYVKLTMPFGGLRREEAAANAEAQAAEVLRAGTRVTVAADSYLQIRGYQARLAVAQNQITTDERLVALVRNRIASGAAADREVAQAEALLKRARASVPPLRLALEQQSNWLDVLMGAQPDTYAKGLSAVRDIPSIPPFQATSIRSTCSAGGCSTSARSMRK